MDWLDWMGDAPAWMDRAACGSTDLHPDAFTDPALMHIGKQVCARCPVRVECLADALRDDDRYGLRGGYTWVERTALVAEWP